MSPRLPLGPTFFHTEKSRQKKCRTDASLRHCHQLVSLELITRLASIMLAAPTGVGRSPSLWPVASLRMFGRDTVQLETELMGAARSDAVSLSGARAAGVCLSQGEFTTAAKASRATTRWRTSLGVFFGYFFGQAKK